MYLKTKKRQTGSNVAKKVLLAISLHHYKGVWDGFEGFLLKEANDGVASRNYNALSLNTVFPHIVSAETILFWIWKFKGHTT